MDSNGNLTVIGGETYVEGPINGANGALDYNGTATIKGGILIAVGSSQMAQNFGDESTQGSIMVTFKGVKAADTEISLKDKNDDILLSFVPKKEYSSVVISTPQIKDKTDYKIISGDEETEITMSGLIYGSSIGMGRTGGQKGENKNIDLKPEMKPNDRTNEDTAQTTAKQ